MSLAVAVIPAAFIGFTLFRYQRQNSGRFGAVSLVLCIYLVMSLLAVGLEILGQARGTHSVQLVPVAYLCACLATGFWGLTAMRDAGFSEIVIENVHLYRLLELFLIASSLIAVLFFLPFAKNSLSGDIKFNRQDLAFGQEALGSWGALNTFCSLAANLFALNLLFAFFNLVPGFGNRRASRFRAMLLLLGSTSYVLYVLAYVGRDGVIFWGITFIFMYLLLRSFISESARRYVKGFAAVALGISLVPFLIITFSRFDGEDGGALLSLAQYGGTQIQQFNDHFIAYSDPQWGRINFPVIYKIVEPGAPTFDRMQWFKLYTDAGVTPWTFSTYVGSFLHDFGKVLTPLVVAAIALGTRRSLRDVKTVGRMSLAQIFVFIVGVQIVMYGVFYFRQSSANTYLIAVFGLALALRLGRAGNRRRRVLVAE